MTYDPYAGPGTAPEPEPAGPRDLPWSGRGLRAGPPLALATAALLFTAWCLFGLLVEEFAAWAVRRSAHWESFGLPEPTASERATPYLLVLGVALLAAVPCVAFVLVQRRLRVGPEALVPWVLLGLVLGVVGGPYLAEATTGMFDRVAVAGTG